MEKSIIFRKIVNLNLKIVYQLNKMTHKCNFCDTVLSSEYSLSKHQKTAKKCLIKQGLDFKGDFNCVICNQLFTLKTTLNIHNISCYKKNILEIENKHNKLSEIENKYNIIENKYNILIDEKKEIETKYNMLLEEKNEWKEKKEIETKYNMLLEEKKEWKEKEEKLLDKITTAALSKTNTVNNKNINITTYTRTDEELKSIYADNLTTTHIEGGISAITKLIIDKVVTDNNGVKMITITDKARGTARYKLPSGEDVVDNGLNNFTTKNRNIIMRRIYSMASSDRAISDQILDVDTIMSKGFMELNEDTEGDGLRSNLIKNI